MDAVLPAGFEIVSDPTPAAWIVDRLWSPWADGRTVRVGAIVPEGFEAYARVFHRLERGKRWRDTAHEHGTKLHHEAQMSALRREPKIDGRRPPDMSWPPRDDEYAAMVSILTRHTSTAERCWFCLWEGNGAWGVNAPPAIVGTPKDRPPSRRYILARAPLDAVMPFVSSIYTPELNIWWPDDRAWCVATEIDYSWTYVGGSRACIDAILADGTLEALETTIDARCDVDGDSVNG